MRYLQGARSPSWQSGTTLVELLLALGIAALVIGLVFSIYHTVSKVSRAQQDRLMASEPAALALNELIRDLTGVFTAGGADENTGFSLKPEDPAENRYMELSFCHARMPPGRGDGNWAWISRVNYRIDPGPSGELRLLKEEYDLAGPSAPQTNVLVARLDAFDVEVTDGTTWSREWPVSPADVVPKAARIEIRSAGQARTGGWKTEVAIPAGHRIESTIERPATAAPTSVPPQE